MDTVVSTYFFPEEQELALKREELAFLRAELADRELFVADLRARLSSFEGRYLREVGVLYAELDDWNARIAELAAEIAGSQGAKSAAKEARWHAEESHAAAHGEAATSAAFLPSPELKSLFREVVKQVHPDTAADEADRALRNRLMAEANAAYSRGDAESLLRILEMYKSSPEAVIGVSIKAELERILRQIAAISKRLVQIESFVAELTSSEMAKLMAKVDSAATQGNNLLDEMAKHVKQRIELARMEYEAVARNWSPVR